jgi:hypothetical protein
MVDFSAEEEDSSLGNGGEAASSSSREYEGDPQEVAVPSRSEQGGVASEGSASGGPQLARGFSFGFSWCLPSGSGAGASLQTCSIDRDYDSGGVLRGVRNSTAVKGGWSGGKM